MGAVETAMSGLVLRARSRQVDRISLSAASIRCACIGPTALSRTAAGKQRTRLLKQKSIDGGLCIHSDRTGQQSPRRRKMNEAVAATGRGGDRCKAGIGQHGVARRQHGHAERAAGAVRGVVRQQRIELPIQFYKPVRRIDNGGYERRGKAGGLRQAYANEFIERSRIGHECELHGGFQSAGVRERTDGERRVENLPQQPRRWGGKSVHACGVPRLGYKRTQANSATRLRVMHELSIATSLIDAIIGHLIESGGARAGRVVVEVGELSGVVPAALQSAFAFAHRQESSLDGATLEIQPVAVTLDCSPCGGERPAVSVNELRCTECGASSSRVVRGRELDIVLIEVIDAAPDA